MKQKWEDYAKIREIEIIMIKPYKDERNWYNDEKTNI